MKDNNMYYLLLEKSAVGGRPHAHLFDSYFDAYDKAEKTDPLWIVRVEIFDTKLERQQWLNVNGGQYHV